MNEIDITMIDLNLLVVLDVLLQERSVTRAAKRLHRTQSATSHALGRLRAQLGDALLVREGGEMRPTPKGERLAEEVSRILRSIEQVLAQEGEFDPRTSRRAFRFAGPDFVAMALPALLARVMEVAPWVSVEALQAGAGTLREVAEGRVDAAITPAPAPRQEGLVSAPLVTLDWAVYARGDHPAAASWGLEAWSRYPHIGIRTSSGAQSPVDDAARAQGVSRRMGPYLPHFLLAAPLLARTDLLMTVPRAVLAEIAPRFGLLALPCPLALAPVSLSLHWSARLERDPAQIWFRDALEAAAREALGLAPRALSPGTSQRR